MEEGDIEFRGIREHNGINCINTSIRGIMNKRKKEELQILIRKNKIDIIGTTQSLTHEGIGNA